MSEPAPMRAPFGGVTALGFNGVDGARWLDGWDDAGEEAQSSNASSQLNSGYWARGTRHFRSLLLSSCS